MPIIMQNGQAVGGGATLASELTATDTEGIIGTAGALVTTQALLDGIAGDLDDLTTEVRNINISGVSLGNIAAGSSKTFQLSTSPAFIGLIFTCHNYASGLGYMAIVRASSFVKPITTTGSVSATASDSVLTITNEASAGTAGAYAIVLSGSISAI